jgi:hypothetical protein
MRSRRAFDPFGPFGIAGRSQSALLAATLGLLQAGCADWAPLNGQPMAWGSPSAKRHAPADIAGYELAQFSAPIASAEGARRAREAAMAQLVRAAAGGADEATITEALRAVAFYDTEIDTGRRLLQAVLRDTAQPLPTRPAEFQRAVLTAAFALDANGTAPLIAPLLDQLATPRPFAIAAYTLRRADGSAAQRQRLRAALARRSDRDDPRLVALTRALDADDALASTGPPTPRPPLADLLAATFKPGLPVIYSLQRRDRRQMGLAIVREADGRFARKPDGTLFAIPQLALALSGLPGTITLGNTPQGLFTVVGSGTADNVWIGPTPVLESKVPKEATASEFAHAPVAGDWTEAMYTAWLPPSWRGYLPMQEAWLAGLAGRDEMWLHGNTADTAPYRQRAWFPGAPTDGCLMAQESWSPEGRLLSSDQLALARVFMRGGSDRGYLVVVEIDDSASPVTLNGVYADITAAEARRAGGAAR